MNPLTCLFLLQVLFFASLQLLVWVLATWSFLNPSEVAIFSFLHFQSTCLTSLIVGSISSILCRSWIRQLSRFLCGLSPPHSKVRPPSFEPPIAVSNVNQCAFSATLHAIESSPSATFAWPWESYPCGTSQFGLVIIRPFTTVLSTWRAPCAETAFDFCLPFCDEPEPKCSILCCFVVGFPIKNVKGLCQDFVRRSYCRYL